MRLNLAAIVMLGLPAMAAAQPAASVAGGAIPLPPIGLPLPPIGLPHPATGLAPLAAPQTRRPVHRPAPSPGRPQQPWPYVVPVYIWPFFYEAPVATTTQNPPQNASAQPRTGHLQFAVVAGDDQQLYVDGYYVGTLVEVDSGVELETGPHAVEIRAPGFDPLRFSVNIAPGRTITYRGTLKAVEVTPAPRATAASSPPSVAPTPMTGYIVPGCYIGNVPPEDAGLPAGCDVSRAITIKP